MKNMKLGLSAAMILALASGAVISTDAQAAEADGGTYNSNGKVGFEANKSTKPVDPVDPTDPTKPPVTPVDPTDPNGPNPGTAGPLSIDYASSIDFGLNEISNEDKVYYANPQTYSGDVDDTANYVQVTDRRGTNAGWSLSVKQNGQFKNDTTQNKELTGSKISLVAGTVTSPTTNAVFPTTTVAELDPTGEATSPILSAAKTQGSGTFANSFGELETVKITVADEEKDVIKNTGISLAVPGNTPKDAVDYTTSLTWILTDAPGQTK